VKIEEKKMSNPKFKTFSLAVGLHNKIREFIKTHSEYRSMNDLVSEAVRIRMEEKEKLEQQKRGEAND